MSNTTSERLRNIPNQRWLRCVCQLVIKRALQGKLEEQNNLSFLLRRVVESGTAMRLVMFVLVALATIALATPKKDGKKSGRRGMSAAEWGAHASNPREDEIEHMMDDGFNEAGNKVHEVLPYTIERA